MDCKNCKHLISRTDTMWQFYCEKKKILIPSIEKADKYKKDYNCNE